MKKNDKNVKKKSGAKKPSNLRKKTSRTATATVTAEVTKEEKSKTKVDVTEEGTTVNVEKAPARAKTSAILKTKSDEVPKKNSGLQPRIVASKDVKKASNLTAKVRTKPSKSDPSSDNKPRPPSAVSSQTSLHSNKSGTKINIANHTGNTVIEEQEGSGPADARCKKSIKDWALGVIKGGIDPILLEYKNLPTAEIPAEKYKTWTANPDLNRYDNTFCLESTRVTVDGAYIHANYAGPEDQTKKFICTQGPMDTTVERFWKMIVTEGAEFIIMLCDPIENKKEKCFKYWPGEVAEKMTYGGVTITNNGSLELETAKPIQVVVSLLDVKFGDKSYLIRHFHWKAWPDHGVPKSFGATTKLSSAIKASTKPVIVHCSAGVGRTGTLVLISMAQARLLKDSFNGILDLLTKLREQRAHVVQNEMQYLYVYRCLIEYYVEKKCVPKKTAEKFFKDYDAFMADNGAKRKKKKDATKEMDAAS